MVLKLYYTAISPPSRSVLLGIRSLGLNVEIDNVNLLKGEHHSERFLSLNPVHQVPVLVDDDFILTESRAILAYLVNKFKPNSSLYPADPKTRAMIDQRLHYDHTVFERNAAAIVRY
jgi:glutathione S-transferase